MDKQLLIVVEITELFDGDYGNLYPDESAMRTAQDITTAYGEYQGPPILEARWI